MKTGSKTLLRPFLVGSALGAGLSSEFSKRSGALRLRVGRLLGVGRGATFLRAGFLGAGLCLSDAACSRTVLSAPVFFVAFPAPVDLGGALCLKTDFLGGCVPPSSSSSSRVRFGLCCCVLLAVRLEEDIVDESDSGAVARCCGIEDPESAVVDGTSSERVD